MGHSFGTAQARSTSRIREEISTNKVLRQTYLLLSATLVVSAAAAGVSMAFALPMPHWILALVISLGLLFGTMAARNSPLGLVLIFAFTGFHGYILGPMLNAYLTILPNGAEVIFTALAATAGIFLGLSAYVLTTKRDFSYLGGFLFAGLIGAILVGLAAWFFALPMLSLAVSGVMVLLMSGYILYDTSEIVNGGETNYISATISLYLDILNLFIHLLQILGALSGDDD